MRRSGYAVVDVAVLGGIATAITGQPPRRKSYADGFRATNKVLTRYERPFLSRLYNRVRPPRRGRLIHRALTARGYRVPSDAQAVRVCMQTDRAGEVCFYPLAFFQEMPTRPPAGVVTCPACGHNQPVGRSGEVPQTELYALASYSDRRLVTKRYRQSRKVA